MGTLQQSAWFTSESNFVGIFLKIQSHTWNAPSRSNNSENFQLNLTLALQEFKDTFTHFVPQIFIFNGELLCVCLYMLPLFSSLQAAWWLRSMHMHLIGVKYTRKESIESISCNTSVGLLHVQHIFTEMLYTYMQVLFNTLVDSLDDTRTSHYIFLGCDWFVGCSRDDKNNSAPVLTWQQRLVNPALICQHSSDPLNFLRCQGFFNHSIMPPILAHGFCSWVMPLISKSYYDKKKASFSPNSLQALSLAKQVSAKGV